MKTGLRLLAMLATFVGLFALSWFLFVRQRPPQQVELPPKVKTTEELLVGTWEVVEQDPPIPKGMEGTIEFTKDGKTITRMANPSSNSQPTGGGIYQLQGDVIRFDYPPNRNHPHVTWVPKIEVLTEDTLILTSSDSNTKRAVCRRVSEN